MTKTSMRSSSRSSKGQKRSRARSNPAGNRSVSPGEKYTAQKSKTDQIQEMANSLNTKFRAIGADTRALAKACFEARTQCTDETKKLLMARLDFHPSEFSKLASVGEKKIFDDPTIFKALPIGYSVQYELSKLPDETIREFVSTGTIHSQMKRSEVDALFPNKQERIKSPKVSLPKNFAVAVRLKADPTEQEVKELLKWISQGRKLGAVSELLDRFEADQKAYDKANVERRKKIQEALWIEAQRRITQKTKGGIGISKKATDEQIADALKNAGCAVTLDELRAVAESSIAEVGKPASLLAA